MCWRRNEWRHLTLFGSVDEISEAASSWMCSTKNPIWKVWREKKIWNVSHLPPRPTIRLIGQVISKDMECPRQEPKVQAIVPPHGKYPLCIRHRNVETEGTTCSGQEHPCRGMCVAGGWWTTCWGSHLCPETNISQTLSSFHSCIVFSVIFLMSGKNIHLSEDASDVDIVNVDCRGTFHLFLHFHIFEDEKDEANHLWQKQSSSLGKHCNKPTKTVVWEDGWTKDTWGSYLGRSRRGR